MITLKTIFYSLVWYLWVVAVCTIGGILIVETFSSIVGLTLMDKAGLDKDTSKMLWSWIQIKPIVIPILFIYIALFTKPDISWVKQMMNLFKGNKKKNAEN
jgi:hypothetical protein